MLGLPVVLNNGFCRLPSMSPEPSTINMCFGVEYWLFSIRRVEVKRFRAFCCIGI